MSADIENLIWLDLEMSGLDPEKDRILEIAIVVTNTDLEVLAEGPVFAIHQSDAVLRGMDSWNQEHHGASGLIDRVKASQITEAQAEREVLNFISQFVGEGKSPMCGNTIHMDRRFLLRYMPKLESYFHYRNLDVSTLKILAKLWAPDVADQFVKESQHVALQDVYDSINELKHYRKHFLKDLK
jgi:oligoribonuclease